MTTATQPRPAAPPRAYYGDTGLRVYGTTRAVVHVAYFDEGTGAVHALTREAGAGPQTGEPEALNDSDLILGADCLDQVKVRAALAKAAGFVRDVNGELRWRS